MPETTGKVPSAFSALFAKLEDALMTLDAARQEHDAASEKVQATAAAYGAAVDEVVTLKRELSDSLAGVLPSNLSARERSS